MALNALDRDGADDKAEAQDVSHWKVPDASATYGTAWGPDCGKLHKYLNAIATP